MMSVVHSDVDLAKKVIDSAFNEIYKIDRLMSIYKENSEVYALNRDGFYEGASADTIHVIKRASYHSGLSNGAFSIAVLPILDLWKRKVAPTEAEISERLELLDHESIITEDGKILFKKNGMGITLGGIAKGYAVDKAIEALRQNGIEHALVNAGGDIRTIGEKTDGVPWKIALRDPEDKKGCTTTADICNKAVATSGNYERSSPHLVDPRTGYATQRMMSATVIADSAMDADALATAVFVLGAEEGIDLVERASAEALITTNDGKILKSSGFP
jgi:thiamine biosynthesis lipoprotein